MGGVTRATAQREFREAALRWGSAIGLSGSEADEANHTCIAIAERFSDAAQRNALLAELLDDPEPAVRLFAGSLLLGFNAGAASTLEELTRAPSLGLITWSARMRLGVWRDLGK